LAAIILRNNSKSATTAKITVRNPQRKVPVDVVDLEKFARKALALCLRVPRKKKTDLVQLPEVSVLIVSDARMAALHRQFMNEPGPTDVITFQHGEIFISAETARRNARRFGNALARELRLYVVHGLLHLHGFDDRNEANGRKMQVVQRRILAEASRLK
jgi:probable rRNA maturation factor